VERIRLRGRGGLDADGGRRGLPGGRITFGAMVDLSSDPMSRRTVAWFAVAGVVLTIAGLVLRPSYIDAAVVAFLLALGGFGLAGYGLLERLVDRWNRRRR
jgi:hypothetical protein